MEDLKVEVIEQTVVKKMQPTAKAPNNLIVRQLSADELKRLEQTLRDPIECVMNPLFKQRSTEALFSAPVDVFAPVKIAAHGGDDETLSAAARRKRNLPRGLTRAQEQDLFLRFNYARYRMMRILKKYADQRLTGAAVRELLRWEDIARTSRDKIVHYNLGLVPTMIERSRMTGLDFSELISEGQLALLRAVSKFDCARGFKFSTYACRAILSSISRSMALTVRHRNFFPTEFDPELQKSDELERRRETATDDFVDELNEILAANLAELTTAEKRVLLERFGVNGDTKKPALGKPKTLRQVAALFGVTKERVRQIQNKALTKLRTALEQRVFAA